MAAALPLSLLPLFHTALSAVAAVAVAAPRIDVRASAWEGPVRTRQVSYKYMVALSITVIVSDRSDTPTRKEGKSILCPRRDRQFSRLAQPRSKSTGGSPAPATVLFRWAKRLMSPILSACLLAWTARPPSLSLPRSALGSTHAIREGAIAAAAAAAAAAVAHIGIVPRK